VRVAKPQYNDRAWRTFRLAILTRDGWRCQLRLDARCAGRADSVDHIIEWDRAPHLRLAPSNAQAACRHCNAVKAARYVNSKASPTVVAPSRVW